MFPANTLDLGQEFLGRYFLAVRVLDASEPGKGAQTRAHGGDDQVRPRNAHLSERVHTLPDDMVELRLNLILVGAGFVSLTFSGDEKDAGSKGG